MPKSLFRKAAKHNRLDINVLRKNRKSRPQPDKKNIFRRATEVMTAYDTAVA